MLYLRLPSFILVIKYKCFIIVSSERTGGPFACVGRKKMEEHTSVLILELSDSPFENMSSSLRISSQGSAMAQCE